MLRLTKLQPGRGQQALVISPVMFWCGWEHNGEKKVKFSLKNMFSTLAFVPRDKNRELIALFQPFSVVKMSKSINQGDVRVLVLRLWSPHLCNEVFADALTEASYSGTLPRFLKSTVRAKKHF